MNRDKHNNIVMTFDELTYMLNVWQELCMNRAKEQLDVPEFMNPAHAVRCDMNTAQFAHDCVSGIDTVFEKWYKAPAEKPIAKYE